MRKNNDLDFDFDIDLNEYEIPTMHGLLLLSAGKKRKFFKIEDERRQIDALLDAPPRSDEVFKLLSVRGGFSSIGLIDFVARNERIEDLYASTFRVGLKQFEVLNNLHFANLLENCSIVTAPIQEMNDAKYDYATPILSGCKKNGWRVAMLNNHSKLILMRTSQNWYVVETSSNLNENPKIEQFSFENDRRLFEFYQDFFEAVFENVEQKTS